MQKRMKGLRGIRMDDYGSTQAGSEFVESQSSPAPFLTSIRHPSTSRPSPPASERPGPNNNARFERPPIATATASGHPPQASTRNGTVQMQSDGKRTSHAGFSSGSDLRKDRSIQNHPPSDQISAGRRNPGTLPDEPPVQSEHRRNPSLDLLFIGGSSESPEAHPSTLDEDDLRDSQTPAGSAGSGQDGHGQQSTNQNQAR